MRSVWSPPAMFLVLLMGFGSVVMWLGVPLGLIYAASRLADTSSPTLGPYLLVFIGLPIGMAVMAKVLAYLDRVHQAYTRTGDDRPQQAPWMRSMRGERGSTRKRGVLDTVMIVSVGLALAGFGVWFFGFAGSSLPGFLTATPLREGVRAAAQNPVHARDRPRHRPRGGQHRLRRRRAPPRPSGRARRRRDRDRAGPGRGRPARDDPRARRRADGRVHAGRGGGRGPLLRGERALGVRGRPGARCRDPRRRPAQRALRLLHAPAGEGGGVRLRAGRRRTRCSGWSRRC